MLAGCLGLRLGGEDEASGLTARLVGWGWAEAGEGGTVSR